MTKRRMMLSGAAAVMTCALLAACSSSPKVAVEPMTEQQKLYLESRERMLRKFGERGFELVVDAMDGQEFLGVEMYPEHAKYPMYQKGGQRLQTRSRSATAGPVPERVRVIWHDSYRLEFTPGVGTRRVGNIIGDEIIEVGSRIPQELIDDLKRDPKGTLRIKFRMSNQGTLVGWDISRRPGYDAKEAQRRIMRGESYPHVSAVHSFVGGDFREARIVQGKVVEKGWYIDKKTGQKIETFGLRSVPGLPL